MSSTTEVRPESSAAEARPPETGASSIADPAPLGLAAFALTTFVLSLFNAKIAPEALEPTVLPLAFFYGGIAQFLAGMWEFRRGNTFGATAFGSYGAFWLSFAAYVQFVEPALESAGATETQVKTATGLFLLGWTLFTLFMLIASLRTTGALIGVFVTLFLTFALLTVADLAGASALGTVGGFVGILTALVAWYAATAIVTNATWGRTVMPVGPRS
ncbi:acetate uptake transporter [Actinomycetospora sp. C-140]